MKTQIRICLTVEFKAVFLIFLVCVAAIAWTACQTRPPVHGAFRGAYIVRR
jgi:hypothetical protein